MNGRILKLSIYLSLFVLSSAMLLGFNVARANPQAAEALLRQLTISFNFLKKLSDFQVFIFIFLNNSIKAFAAMVFGIFFGIFPVLFLVINGYLIGLVFYVSKDSFGYPQTILSLLPHGIFELSGVLTACGLGIFLGIKLAQRIRGRGKYLMSLRYAFRRFLLIALPLILLGSFVEAYITPLILNYFFKL